MTVALASHTGSDAANASHIDDGVAPLRALVTAASRMIAQSEIASASAAAADRKTAPESDKLPHGLDAIIAMTGKSDLGIIAGQDIQAGSGETVTFMSGRDSQLPVAGVPTKHQRECCQYLLRKNAIS